VTPIRPNAFPVQPSPPQGADAARQAAQRAFFDAAMGRSAGVQTPPAATPAASPTFAAVARAEIRPQPDAPAPAKLLRPGSLLDIRV